MSTAEMILCGSILLTQAVSFLASWRRLRDGKRRLKKMSEERFYAKYPEQDR